LAGGCEAIRARDARLNVDRPIKDDMRPVASMAPSAVSGMSAVPCGVVRGARHPRDFAPGEAGRLGARETAGTFC
jgi:hypothetical protein